MTPESAPTTGTIVQIERRIAARPETVFSFFTDPEKYKLWFGFEAELDPRPGGRYRIVVTGKTRRAVAGEYILVDPPSTLVYTWGWEKAVDEPRLAAVPVGSSTIEVNLIPDGDGTLVRVRHAGLPSEASADFHRWGWNHTLDRLEIAAAGGDPGPDLLEDM